MVWLLALVAFASDSTQFETIVRDSLAACAPGVALTAVNCEAEPCVAIFSDEKVDWGAITHCPAWRDAYGSTASTRAGHAVCDDGRKLPYLLVAPDQGGPRAAARVKAVRKVFPCGTVAPTPNSASQPK
jgi:hypothetical protein